MWGSLGNLITTAAWSGEASQWLLPFFVAPLCYAAFKWLDSITSDEFRTECVKFLLEKKYNYQIKLMPDFAEHVIDKVFGDQHVTKKCFIRSMLFSSSSLLIAFVISFLYNPQKNLQFFNKILSLDIRRFMYLLLVWVLFCLIPDYIMLGKTRGIIWALQRANLNSTNIILIAIIDFLISNFTFMAIFVGFQIFSLEIYQWHTGKTPNPFSYFSTTSVFIFPVFLIVESVILIPSGVLYFLFPLANFFWAAMIPSAWLWLYIVSSIISRLLLSINPLFDVLTRVLDIKNQPFRSIGIFASVFVAIIAFFSVLLLSIFK